MVVIELYCRLQKEAGEIGTNMSVKIRNPPQIIRVITSTRRRWDNHVTHMGRINFTHDFSAETCEKKTT